MAPEDEFIIRPISRNDFDWLYELTSIIGVGFTSLPKNKDYLRRRIDISIKSFEGLNPVEERLYLLVRENVITKDLVGLCGIDAKVGNQVPFYNFKISTVSQACESLNKYFEHQVLRLVNDFQDATELISLYLHPNFRGKNVGRWLSYARLLLIAQYPEWFGDEVIAEIRGVSDSLGVNPFWEAIGRHFFDMDFVDADYLTMSAGKQFISDLMPRDPIYVKLLPPTARKVLGEPHQSAAPAKHMLEKQGFLYKGYVDIFDGGPLIVADKQNISIVRESKLAKVNIVNEIKSGGQDLMLCNDKREFRVTLANVLVEDAAIINMDNETAERLLVENGDQVRYTELQDTYV